MLLKVEIYVPSGIDVDELRNRKSTRKTMCGRSYYFIESTVPQIVRCTVIFEPLKGEKMLQ